MIPLLIFITAAAAQWSTPPVWEIPGTWNSDSPSCTTVDAGHWDSDVPRMHSDLAAAFSDFYVPTYAATCTSTAAAPTPTEEIAIAECPLQFLDYCSFSAVVPTSLRSEYNAYTSSASSWWGVHSSRVFEIVDECPSSWILALVMSEAGSYWFRFGAAFGECAMAAGETGEVSAVVPTQTEAQPGGSKGTEGTPEPTQDSGALGMKMSWGVAVLVAFMMC